MRVKCLDKSLKSFVLLSALMVAFSCLVLVFLGIIYRYSTIYTYNNILLIGMILTILIISVFVLSAAAVFSVYRREKAAGWLAPLAQAGLGIVFPLIMAVSSFIKGGKDAVRDFFIKVNNILVQSGLRKYDKSRILVLLPHCLQHSGCSYKVTGSLDNCVRCGRCRIGELAVLAEKTGVRIQVVTGGTIARQLVDSMKPELILSVACERDLVSGIRDVGRIPVIGIVNERPNGPCNSTTVDVDILKEFLENVMKNEE
jgi:uncharacterized protein